MPKVVGVRLDGNQRVYNCCVEDARLSPGTMIICVRDNYEYFGEVVRTAMDIPERYITDETYRYLRVAGTDDLAERQKKIDYEAEALAFAKSAAAESGLEMNFIAAYLSEADEKFMFYFLADERIDFRQLVKQLAYRYRMRIELRQVGTKDKARYSGGLGVCGQEQCCSRFLRAYPQVSIKVAKEQNLSVNSSKSTGACGRLLCCLQYEQLWYEESLSKMPHLGHTLATVYGKGEVKAVNLQREIIQIKLETAKDSDPWQVVHMEDITDERFLRRYRAGDLKHEQAADNAADDAFTEFAADKQKKDKRTFGETGDETASSIVSGARRSANADVTGEANRKVTDKRAADKEATNKVGHKDARNKNRNKVYDSKKGGQVSSRGRGAEQGAEAGAVEFKSENVQNACCMTSGGKTCCRLRETGSESVYIKGENYEILEVYSSDIEVQSTEMLTESEV